MPSLVWTDNASLNRLGTSAGSMVGSNVGGTNSGCEVGSTVAVMVGLGMEVNVAVGVIVGDGVGEGVTVVACPHPTNDRLMIMKIMTWKSFFIFTHFLETLLEV